MKTVITIVGVLIALAVVWFFFFAPSPQPDGREVGLPPINNENAARDTEELLPPQDEDDTTPGLSEEETSAGGENLVTYTGSGFAPREITIKKGDAVTFVNESSSGMWVASAVHPTHTVYPEKSANDCLGSSFDACESISNGGTWSFTFNEAGEWKYHNHVQASHVGTIIVE